MTDRPHGFVARGFGFAFAIIVITTLGVSSQASAAAAKQLVVPQTRVEVSKVFGATLKSSLPNRRVDVAIDPIDPNIRHMWPDLTDSSGTVAHGQP